MLPVPHFIRPIARTVIALPGRAVPYAAQRPLLELALSQALRAPLRAGELEFLEGSRIRIVVTDLCLDWLLQVRAERIDVIDRVLREDVRISGSGLDFILLATRQADPDTLFFQRRIRIEGDTELGLGVKNTMDSMDWDDLPPPLRRFLQIVSRVIGNLPFARPSAGQGSGTP